MPSQKPNLPQKLSFYTLIALTLLLYIRLFGFDFVTWDDHTIIVNNPIVQSGFSSWDGVFDIGTYARFMPLAWLSFKTVSATMGMDPAYFHASNVLLHLINTSLLYALVSWIISIKSKGCSDDKVYTWRHWLTFSLVTFWAWHPLRAEPVAWATGLTYNVSTLFLLGSLLCLIAYEQFGRMPAAACSVVLIACSIATYPPAITWPLAVPIFYLVMRSNDTNWKPFLSKALSDIRKRAIVFIPTILVSGLFLSFTLIGRFMGKSLWYSDDALINASQHLGLLERILNSLYSGSGLLQRMLLPLELSPAWPPQQVRTITIVSAVALLLTLVIFLFTFLKKSPRASMSLIIIGITAIPVIGLTDGLFYQPDRYTHILQLVIVVVVASALPFKAIYSALSQRPIVSRVVLIGLALTLATLNFNQQSIWANSYTLFDHLEQVSWVRQNEERLGQVQCLRARKLTSEKRYAEAATIYAPLLRNRPHPYYVIYFASINYMLMGNTERALNLAEEAAQLDQRDEIMSLLNHLRGSQ